MNDTDQRLQNLAARARRSQSPTLADELPLGFATRVLAHAREAEIVAPDDSAALWSRLALAALPLAALAAAACVYWPADDNDAGPQALANLIVESQFQP